MANTNPGAAIRENKKEAKRIAAALILLCAVSIYRQAGIRFFPDDLVRPVVVYVIYLALLAGWNGSIRTRITQGNMRIFMLASQAFMFIGITTRFLQDVLLHYDSYLMRVSGYWAGAPVFVFPLLGLLAAFGLGKTEEYRVNRKWFFLFIPAGILVLLLLTNEHHYFIFLQELPVSIYFRPNAGMILLLVWAFSLEFARIFLIYRRSRETKDYPRFRIVPLLIPVFMLVISVYYLFISFVVDFELIEFYIFIYFLEIMVWESCIMIGMVPVNTHYEEVFDRSTVAMQILNQNGEPYLKSANAPVLSPVLVAQLMQEGIVRMPKGQELHIRTIHGGFVVWQNDISQTLALIDELQKSAERLEYESDILRNELKIQSDTVSVKEQIRIYNQLTDEIGGQLNLLHRLLQDRDVVKDKDALFKKICLVGTYVKRRCNLRLIEQSDGVIANEELSFCYDELSGCLHQMGVKVAIAWQGTEPLAPEFAIFALDLFEFLIEYEKFELRGIRVCFENGSTFSMHVQTDASPKGKQEKSPHEPALPIQLQHINKDKYDLQWQTLEGGYLVSATCNTAPLPVICGESPLPAVCSEVPLSVAHGIKHS